VRGDAGALNSPNRAQGSRYWKGATVHICLRVDQASIPLGHSTGFRSGKGHAGECRRPRSAELRRGGDQSIVSLVCSAGHLSYQAMRHSRRRGDPRGTGTVRVPLSGAHLSEAASALTNEPQGAPAARRCGSLGPSSRSDTMSGSCGPGRLPADRWDTAGAVICVPGVGVNMYIPGAPDAAHPPQSRSARRSQGGTCDEKSGNPGQARRQRASETMVDGRHRRDCRTHRRAHPGGAERCFAATPADCGVSRPPASSGCRRGLRRRCFHVRAR
jgi:hypothetical protein